MSDIIVNLPNGMGKARFPEGTSRDVIEAEVSKIPVPNKPEAAAGAFASGLLANYGDEAKAAVHAAIPGVIEAANTKLFDAPSWLPDFLKAAETSRPVSTAPTYSERYDEELAKERQNQKNFQTTNPVLAEGSNIAGNVAGAFAALPAAATRAAPTFLGNVAKGALVGAPLGALSASGEGEGVYDRINKAIVGGAAGGLTGAAIPVVGAGGRAALESPPGRFISENVVSPFIRAIANVLGQGAPRSLSAAAPEGGQAGGLLTRAADATGNVAQQAAVERLAIALQRGKLDPERITSRLGQLGDQAVIADLDPQFMSLARGARTMPGETRTIAENVLTGRENQTPGMMRRAFEGDEGAPDRFFLTAGRDKLPEGNIFSQYATEQGAAPYAAMRGEKLRVSGEMQDLLKVPAVQEAEAAIRADAAHEGKQLLPVEIAHRMKQKLNDIADAAYRSGTAINKNDIGELANRWQQAFWEANPLAKTADTIYAKAKALPDFYQAGHNFLAGASTEGGLESSAPALNRLLQGGDAAGQRATRFGSTNVVQERTGDLGGLAFTNRLAKGLPLEGVVPKIEAIYGRPQAAEIQRVADALRTFAKTKQDVMGGSQSMDKLAEITDSGGLSLRAGKGGITARMIESAGDIINKAIAPNEAVRDAIGKVTLNTDASENARILALAAELRKGRMAPTLRGGYSSAAGTAGGNQ